VSKILQPKENVWALNEISNEIIHRMPTGVEDLDYIYGKTEILLPAFILEKGLPKGKISYWAGERGVGKTRLAILISKVMNRMGATILVCQGEVDPKDFKQWTGNNVTYPGKYFVTNSNNMKNIVHIIKDKNPDMIIIDSANMIEGWENKRELKKLFPSFSKAIASSGAHAIMIAQLNQDGTIKGGTLPSHLVDIEASIRRCKWPKKSEYLPPDYYTRLFVIKINKNRYGPSGGWVRFIHEDKGILYDWSSYRVDIDSSAYERKTKEFQNYSLQVNNWLKMAK